MSEPILNEVAPQIREALEQGTDIEKRIMALLTERRESNQQLRRILTMLDPNFRPPSPSRVIKRAKSQPSRIGIQQRNGVATGHGISLERVEPYVNYILRETDAGRLDLTQGAAWRALGDLQTTASSAFRFLLSIGFLRVNGRTTGLHPRLVYRVADRDAFERAKAETMPA